MYHGINVQTFILISGGFFVGEGGEGARVALLPLPQLFSCPELCLQQCKFSTFATFRIKEKPRGASRIKNKV